MNKRELHSETLEVDMVARALKVSGEKTAHSARQGKILLVDENQKDLEACLSILRAQGILDVSPCHSFAQAVQSLDHEEFDFVIVDQGSPAFEGQSVVKRALVADRHKPVIVLARNHDMNCYIEAMQLGAVDYLEKPLSDSDLIRLLRTHLPMRISATLEPSAVH